MSKRVTLATFCLFVLLSFCLSYGLSQTPPFPVGVGGGGGGATGPTGATGPAGATGPTGPAGEGGGSGAKMVEYVGSKCQNGFASSGFSYATSGFPTAACTTDTDGDGVLQFLDAATATVNDRFVLPSTITTGSLDIWWRTSVVANDVVWQLQTVCVAAGEASINPTYNAAQTVTSTAQGTTLRPHKATIASITLTGCAANEILRFKLFRDPAHASDSLAATADLISAVFTVQP